MVEGGEKINPAILVWARETAGLEQEEAASRISLGSSRTSSALMRLQELETGQRLPTRKQLEEIAKLYRRPILTFYRPAPPLKGERGKDFRTFGSELTKRENGLLDALIRNVKARQEMLINTLDDDEVSRSLEFVGSCAISDGVVVIADRISKDLKLDDMSRRSYTVDDFFNELRARIESLGVFVLLIGDLGSHHSALSEQVFRGFTLSNRTAPFIVINDRDAKVARPFTLLHELTHIYLGQSAISGCEVQSHSTSTYPAIEKFCDEVAGNILLPSSAIQKTFSKVDSQDHVSLLDYVRQTADQWRVSEPLVAYKLRTLGLIGFSAYSDLRNVFKERWETYKTQEKPESQGGPSYYVVRTHRLGKALIDAVRRALRENRVTHIKAATILGVKPSSVENLFLPSKHRATHQEVA